MWTTLTLSAAPTIYILSSFNSSSFYQRKLFLSSLFLYLLFLSRAINKHTYRGWFCSFQWRITIIIPCCFLVLLLPQVLWEVLTMVIVVWIMITNLRREWKMLEMAYCHRLMWVITKRKGRKRLESQDMLFKRGAKLIFLMMAIDGGNMAKKLLRTTNSPGMVFSWGCLLILHLVFQGMAPAMFDLVYNIYYLINLYKEFDPTYHKSYYTFDWTWIIKNEVMLNLWLI